MWSIDRDKQIRTLKLKHNIRLAKAKHAEYIDSGKRIIAYYTNGDVMMWHASTGEYIRSFAVSDKPCSSATYMTTVVMSREEVIPRVPSTKLGKGPRTRRHAKLRSARKKGSIDVEDIVSFKDPIMCCAVSPDSSQLVCVDKHNKVSLWCIENGKCINSVTSKRDYDNKFSSPCMYVGDEPVYIKSVKSETRLMSAKTGKSLVGIDNTHMHSVPWHTSTDGYTAVTFISHDEDVIIWDMRTGSRLHVYDLYIQSDSSKRTDSLIDMIGSDTDDNDTSLTDMLACM